MSDFAITWEEAVSVFLSAQSDGNSSIWLQARMAEVVEDHFGGDSAAGRAAALRRFASEVRYSASTLRKYARTSRFFPPGTTIDDLEFTMHRIAANHCPDAATAQAALGHAAEGEWSTRAFQDWCMAQFGLKVEGDLLETGDGRLLLDNEDILERLRRFAGLRVRLQARVLTDDD